MNNNYNKVYDIIKYDSQESNIDIIELLNDLPYNMELADSLDMNLMDLTIITIEIEKDLVYNNLENGDIINYDLELKNGVLKNFSDIVLNKNNLRLKLNRLNITWYCTKEYFYQLHNITIIK